MAPGSSGMQKHPQNAENAALDAANGAAGVSILSLGNRGDVSILYPFVTVSQS